MTQTTRETDALDSQRGGSVDLRAVVASIRTAYETMEMPARRYALTVLLPALFVAVFAVVVVVVARPPLTVAGPLLALGVLLSTAAVVYPKLDADRRRKNIDERFHLYVTHLTVLSTTNIDRIEIFRTLAGESEYGVLAEETARIVALVETWNQSLEAACRHRAKRVPSPLFADFLDRMAYALGAGQDLSAFLLNEQDAMLGMFAITYENDLEKLSVLKELYLSMTLSTTFALVFGIIVPLLTGVEPTLVVGGIVALFVVVQAGFVLLVHMVSPFDPVWYASDLTTTARDRRIRRSHVVGVGGVLVLAVAELAVFVGLLPVSASAVPLPLYVAIPLLPLLYPAWVMRDEEAKITGRDAEFGSFIRVLGAVESVKQSSTARVLATLRTKEFGPLTAQIESLYTRLSLRIDDEAGWRLFAAETGSALIQKFSEMYVVGRRMGGEPSRLGGLINSNFGTVMALRERRTQETTTIVGIVYGVTATSVFAFFVGLEVVNLLMAVAGTMQTDSTFVSGIFYTEVYDVSLITYLLLLLVLVNALLSSVMIRLIDRGHLSNAYLHFVLLTWLGAVTATVTKVVVASVVSV
jgi:flagellar protein FlaJ